MIRRGAKLHAKNANGQTPLHFALESGNLEAVRALVAHGADVEEEFFQDRMRPLHLAARSNHSDVVKFLLLECKADATAELASGRTCFHFAACNANVEIMKLLIEKSANINALDDENCTPLCLAIQQRISTTALEFMLKNGACPNLALKLSYNVEYSPLYFAVKNGSFETVKLLVEVGKCSLDATAFCVAAERNQLEIVKYLVENGADVNAPAYGDDRRYVQ